MICLNKMIEVDYGIVLFDSKNHKAKKKILFVSCKRSGKK